MRNAHNRHPTEVTGRSRESAESLDHAGNEVKQEAKRSAPAAFGGDTRQNFEKTRVLEADTVPVVSLPSRISDVVFHCKNGGERRY